MTGNPHSGWFHWRHGWHFKRLDDGTVSLKQEVDGHMLEIDQPVLGGCVGHNCRLGSGLVIYPARTIESDVVLISSPNRRVIMKNISFEESDHHVTYEVHYGKDRSHPAPCKDDTLAWPR